jgi:hypothetical protein
LQSRPFRARIGFRLGAYGKCRITVITNNRVLSRPAAAGNQYLEDHLLRYYLRRILPADMLSEVEPDFACFGGCVVEDISAKAADALLHPPRLAQFDPWGRSLLFLATATRDSVPFVPPVQGTGKTK